MPQDIVVIGASAGGVEAISTILRGLPPDFPASVFLVVHIPVDSPSVLPKLLTRAGKLPAVHPTDGQKVESGNIYVAPPAYHLLLAPGHLHLSRGPRENGHRPAIDPLFRSAALSYGERVVGVVLSGNLDDGTAGLQLLRAGGGTALVQDPEEAMYPGMPRNAMERVDGAEILSLTDIARRLIELAGPTRGPDGSNGSPRIAPSRRLDMKKNGDEAGAQKEIPPREDLGKVRDESSGLSCPECQGSLWAEELGGTLTFRCRVGHAYNSDTLQAAQTEGVEAALWAALNALEEKADLARRVMRRVERGGRSERRLLEQVEEATQQARIIRELLLSPLVAPPAAR